jgi:hypothetical protein
VLLIPVFRSSINALFVNDTRRHSSTSWAETQFESAGTSATASMVSQ